jgi:hypothetical protein
VEYNDVAGQRMAGKVSGVLPDGRPLKASVLIERENDDEFVIFVKGTAGDEEYADVGRFVRKR